MKLYLVRHAEAVVCIRFERPGPFGPYRWQKKKSELDSDERAAWERALAKTAPAAKAKE